MLYFDQLVSIADHLHNIKHDMSPSAEQQTNILNKSQESKNVVKKIINAFTTHGTIKAIKAILPKNKRRSNRLTRQKLKL